MNSVLLAVSGGRDSVVLAHLMHNSDQRIAIAHCNFHLRLGDCDRDQLFVKSLAEGYGVPFFTTDFDTKGFADEHGYSVEEAARLLRYRFFADICRQHGFDCVATAHHRDDSIETFFLNLFRGTGIAGLHGIRPQSELLIQDYELTIIRPLLDYSRADIDTYVREHNLQYVEDYTNYQLDARRNRIRLQLIPLLRELYPSIDTTMQANIDRLYDAELIYRAYVDELRSRLVRPYKPMLPTLRLDAVEIDISRLESEIRRIGAGQTIMFELLRPYGFNADTAATILRSLDAPSGAMFHSGSHTAELHRGLLIIVPDITPIPPEITTEEAQLHTQAIIHSGNQSIVVDADNVRQPFTLRLWRDGDRFRPFGMKGSRLVSDFLKDLGMPQVERRHVHILVDNEGQPVWLVGLRPDERTRVTYATTRVLNIHLK